MPYTVEITKSAEKELSKLPKPIYKQARAAIDDLQYDPFPHGYIHLKGEENFYRIRQGNYRIVYEVYNEVLIIKVIRVQHRKDVYRGL